MNFGCSNEDDVDGRERKYRELYVEREPALFKYDRISSAQGRQALR